jgi:RNA polymerase sigma-70 factor (ECF subfamily)
MMDEANERTEMELIHRCQLGEIEAFDELMNRYRRRLFSYLYRLCGNRTVAEDLLQETMIKIWRGIKRFSTDYRFSTWSFTIAYRLAIDEKRKRKVRMGIFATAPREYTEVDRVTPLENLEDQEIRTAVRKALAGLPEKQRQVFLLRQHGEMSFKEIAHLTGEPLNTVLSHMHYAVKKLSNSLRESHVV